MVHMNDYLARPVEPVKPVSAVLLGVSLTAVIWGGIVFMAVDGLFDWVM